MNNKQVKRLRRLGLDTKRAKRGFQTLEHDQKKNVLDSVAHMQMIKTLEENLAKIQAKEDATKVEVIE